MARRARFRERAAVAVLTYFHIVFGEMLPKSLALQSAERIALVVHAADAVDPDACLPLVIALNGIGNMLLEPFGINRRTQNADQYYTPEELQLIVEESEEQGALRSESGQVLQELFEFGELTAGEVMVPRVRITGIPVGAERRTSCARSSAARRTRAIRSTRATSITSSGRTTSRICCACC